MFQTGRKRRRAEITGANSTRENHKWRKNKHALVEFLPKGTGDKIIPNELSLLFIWFVDKGASDNWQAAIVTCTFYALSL
jgi:hypothetical protein